ncbi:hypothetical protein J5N97_027848 [Dioscorea zingiberensis]|uniref:RING-type E3 ubiquitin transferase n=1 Tax=Dioscorea zingiberensis TaxID=325984 RepID=A0A9D5BY27_9LILI|nr:hypothetical protein J5N97_027848 [Dioscorea zingiberensis]
MEILFLKALLNKISRFDLLSSSNNIKVEMVRRYCQNIDKILKLLKPVLEGVSEVDLDEHLSKVLKELDSFVNEARELIESWHHTMSKVYFIMHIESAMMKIQTLALDICELLKTLPSSTVNGSTSEYIEHFVQKIQHMHYERTSDIIKEAIRDQREKRMPRPEHLEKVSDSLSLSSNQELLMEVVALDKLKSKIGHVEKHGEVEQIDHMIALVTHMHECLVRIKQVHSINGVPIPHDFCCPLSLELMSDPVIVASGQTYERAFIKKWLGQGLTVCPKTRQTLVHTNLIPNYTVKALIANWCESNEITLPDPVKSVSLSLPAAFLSCADLNDDDYDINHSVRSPRSPQSPDPDVPKLSAHNNAVSSNGSLQETYQPEKHPTLSTGSTLPIVNGFEKDISKMSLNGSEDLQQSSSEVRHVDSGGQFSSHSGEHASPDDDRYQGHNRSVSASNVVSANDSLPPGGDANLVSRVSSDLTHYSSDNSGEVVQEAPASSAPLREHPFPLRLSESRSRSQTIWRRPSERFSPRIVSSPSIDSRPDLSGIETEVRRLIDDLNSDSIETQRAATAGIRLLAKHNMENRIVIANCGAISLLVGLLHSTDQKTQENAVTALLNLSINDNNKTAIANADAIDPLIHVLETGNPEAKENAAATLFSLSVIEENKVKIGRSSAIKPLVELLGNGTPRGKKDAATALFNLSIFHENKARIVQAGAVRHLVELMDPAAGMVDKAVAVLANLATIPEGRNAIGHEGGIPVLVEVVELGSSRGKENAAAALLQLCTNSNRFCSQVLQEGAVPPLVALSQSGTPRAKEKAQVHWSRLRGIALSSPVLLHRNESRSLSLNEEIHMDDERSFSYGQWKSGSHKRRSCFQVDNGKHKRQNFSHDFGTAKPIDTIYRILCPAKRIGSVLGRGGDIINALRDKTHAKIRVADAIPGSEERVVIIFSYPSKESGNIGSDPELEDGYLTEGREEMRPLCPAQDALLKVHDRITGDYIHGGVVHEGGEYDDGDAIARILVPNNQVGCLLGKGGTMIQKLRSETSASIRILPAEHLPPCAMHTDELVQISGMPHVVKRALYEVSSLLHQHPRKENPPLEDLIFSSTKGLYTSGPLLPRSVSQGNTGWPHKHPGFHDAPMSRIGGFMNESPGYGSGAANNARARDSQDALGEFSMRILCATEKIGGLIGKGGVNVRQLEQHTGAHIQVEDTGPEADERVILVSSKEAPWDKNSPTIDAILQLQNKASATSEKGTITTRLLVPSSKVGCLLGQGGNIITEMRMRTRADIRVYSKDDKPKYTPSNEELVQISGTNSVAKEALIEIASRLRERTLRGAINPVPHEPLRRVTSFDDFYDRGIPSSAMVGPRNTTSYEHPKRDSGRPYEAREYPGPLTAAGYLGSAGGGGYQSSVGADGYWSPRSVSGYPGPVTAAEYPGPSSADRYSGPASATRYSGPATAARYQVPANADGYHGRPNAAGYHNAPISTGYDGPSNSTGYSKMNSSVEIKIPRSAAASVLGAGGSNISGIRQISGARVKLHEPLSGASECVVEIQGSSDQMKAAQSLIHAFIASGGCDVPPPAYVPHSF